MLGRHNHLVGHEEGGVEAHAKLTNQVAELSSTTRLLQLVEEVRCAGLGNRAEVVDEVRLGHADAGVGNVKDVSLLVGLDLDAQLLRGGQLGRVRQRQEADLVERVRGVGDQLPIKIVMRKVFTNIVLCRNQSCGSGFGNFLNTDLNSANYWIRIQIRCTDTLRYKERIHNTSENNTLKKVLICSGVFLFFLSPKVSPETREILNRSTILREKSLLNFSEKTIILRNFILILK